MNTACTSGSVVIDFAEVWFEAWLREWDDLGRLHLLHIQREHIDQHDIRGFSTMFTKGNAACCCFNCRVYAAWEKRHDPIERPRAARRRGR